MASWFFAKVVQPFGEFKRDTPVYVRRTAPSGLFVVMECGAAEPKIQQLTYQEAATYLLSRRSRGQVVYLEPRDEWIADMELEAANAR